MTRDDIGTIPQGRLTVGGSLSTEGLLVAVVTKLGLHPKIVQGSVHIYGMTEGVDYTIEYDLGTISFLQPKPLGVFDLTYPYTPSRKKRGKRKVKEWWNK